MLTLPLSGGQMPGLLKTLFKEGSWALFFELVKIYFAPLLAGLTIVGGYLQQLPWAYTLAAATIVFAMTATGILRFSEWLQRIRVEDKFQFVNISAGIDAVKDAAGNRTVKRVQFNPNFLNR